MENYFSIMKNLAKLLFHSFKATCAACLLMLSPPFFQLLEQAIILGPIFFPGGKWKHTAE